MYIIDSSMEIPDIEYLEDKMVESMSQGIAMRDLTKLYNEFRMDRDAAAKNLMEAYGIANPNSSQQVLDYYNTVLNKDIIYALEKSGLNATKSDIMPYVYRLFKDGVHEITEETVIEYGITITDDREALIDCLSMLVNNDIINSMYRNDKWTTNKEAMSELALKEHQDAIDILTYRKAKKYAESVQSFIEAIRGDGMVHPQVSLGKTNRINYSNPALMNIPKQLLWNMVGPRRPGNMLVSVDIKQQEPWIMINLLGISNLRALLESNGDLYEEVFKQIFDREPEPIERKELKTSWNAMTYGATIYGIRAQCRNIDGDKVYKYFNSIPEFKKYKSKCNALAKKNVQTATTYFGTKLFANEVGSKLKRVLMDIPIQGTGADILALLVKHFYDELDNRDIEDMMDIYYTRHDEVIIEVQQELVNDIGSEKIFDIVRDIFEHKVDDWEPFKVEIKEVKEDIEQLFVEEE